MLTNGWRELFGNLMSKERMRNAGGEIKKVSGGCRVTWSEKKKERKEKQNSTHPICVPWESEWGVRRGEERREELHNCWFSFVFFFFFKEKPLLYCRCVSLADKDFVSSGWFNAVFFFPPFLPASSILSAVTFTFALTVAFVFFFSFKGSSH